jgi:hypothetical protein
VEIICGGAVEEGLNILLNPLYDAADLVELGKLVSASV